MDLQRKWELKFAAEMICQFSFEYWRDLRKFGSAKGEKVGFFCCSLFLVFFFCFFILLRGLLIPLRLFFPYT